MGSGNADVSVSGNRRPTTSAESRPPLPPPNPLLGQTVDDEPAVPLVPTTAAQRAADGIAAARSAVSDLRLQLAIMRDSMGASGLSPSFDR